uniref:hypothetical protein n=1 Tax=uncultured Sphingomonas sp. TaxID=158754 RepID=UPI0035CABECB
MPVILLAMAAYGATCRNTNETAIPVIVLPHDVFEDDIVVYPTKAVQIAPIAKRIEETSVDLSVVTDGLVSGTSRPSDDQPRAEQAWNDLNKTTLKIDPVR